MGDQPPAPLPFPDSLCHVCAAPPRYIRTERSVFVLCPLVPEKYPRQPVRSCPFFRPREADPGRESEPGSGAASGPGSG